MIVQSHSFVSVGSQAPSVRSVRPAQFQYDLKPGHGYVPKAARPASDIDSHYSVASQRVSLSPHAAPTAGGKLYVPPSRVSGHMLCLVVQSCSTGCGHHSI